MNLLTILCAIGQVIISAYLVFSQGHQGLAYLLLFTLSLVLLVILLIPFAPTRVP